jgi:trehalose-phosphatase
LITAKRLWLFLDYDGTLADFEPTPATIRPDPTLAALLESLVRLPGLRLASVSGRRLADLRVLLPVPGMWLAGTYGAEWWMPDGTLVKHLDKDDKDNIRPTLDVIKSEWETLIAPEPRFYLEDKGVSLALHGKQVEDHQALTTLTAARRVIESLPRPGLRILGGEKFLEAAPAGIDKGRAVQYLLETAAPWPGADLAYVGDDDKDEVAFATVRNLGGANILVSKTEHPTKADYLLETPQHTRQWLERLARGRGGA